MEVQDREIKQHMAAQVSEKVSGAPFRGESMLQRSTYFTEEEPFTEEHTFTGAAIRGAPVKARLWVTGGLAL